MTRTPDRDAPDRTPPPAHPVRGGAASPAPGPAEPSRTGDTLRRLLARILRRPGAVAGVVGLGAVAATLSAASVGAVVPVLHVVLSADGDPLETLRARGELGARLADACAAQFGTTRFDVLVGIVVALAVSVLAAATFAYLHDLAAARLSQRFQTELAEELFDRLTEQDERTLRRTGLGDLTARFTYDLDMAGKAADTFVNTLVVEPLTAVAYFVLALLVSWKLTLVAVLTVPLVLVLARGLGKRTRRSAEGFLGKRAEVLGRVQETVQGLAVVQVYGQEERERARFRGVTERVRAWGRKLARLEAMNSPALEVAGVVALAPVLLYGGHLVLRSGELAPESFLGVFVLLVSFYAPLRKAIGASNRLQGGIAGAARIFATMDVRGEVVERPGAQPLRADAEGLAWEGVSVTYADGRVGLRDVTLTIPAGRTTALAGPSGAGKTTLLLTIPRLLDPTAGRVTLGGTDLRDVTLASLRGRIAIVTQEPRLFGGTLAENVAYGRPGATREELDRAARAARADEIVARLPDGWDTVLDEGGHGLSGGEKQRIAIARAVLRDPAILLLDEPTASLDPANERLVREALADLCRGRTTVVVAHRPDTVRAADHVVVLREGRLAAAGPPDVVERTCETFRELFPRSPL